MATPRDMVVAAVAPLETQTDVRVLPYARKIDSTGTAGTVMVRVDEVAPTPGAPSMWTYNVAVVVVVPDSTTEATEDKLDALLELVLGYLDDNAPGVVWTSARRAVFEDKFPAYEITCTVHVNTKE